MEAAKKPEKRYTYADYSKWPEDERWELIEGVPYAMASPTIAHQLIIGEIFGQLRERLKGKPCQVFVAPLSVRLNAGEGDDTVVEPDILVVCDKTKLESGKSVIGAPDFIAEVLSPSTAHRDLMTKFKLYRQSGVREYWVIDPDSKLLMTYNFRSGRFSGSMYSADDSAVPIDCLEGCAINLTEAFSGLPEVSEESEE